MMASFVTARSEQEILIFVAKLN